MKRVTKSSKKQTSVPASTRRATLSPKGEKKALNGKKADAPKKAAAKKGEAAPAVPGAAPKSDTIPPPRSEELDAYLALLEEIWGEVHPLIGAVTLSALIKSAARRLAPAHPCVATLAVSIDGINRDEVRRSMRGAQPHEATAALRDLVRDLLTLFESIAGPVIVRLLLPKIVRAEKGVQPAAS